MHTLAAVDPTILMAIVIGAVIFVGTIFLALKCYRKVIQGQAIIRTGLRGTNVSFSGLLIIPVIERMELMDIGVKRIEIVRRAKDGLICKDNMRADITVAFFVRVNKTAEDVMSVAETLGVQRASSQAALEELFDAKFSEALKSVGKQFAFEDLYTKRADFRELIKQEIGTDLNGYSLEDAAIDYLEQTPKEMLNPDNILDASGLEKIATITREKKININFQEREEEKAITRQDVDAREKILDMEKELAEAEEKQRLEIANIKARTESEEKQIFEQERLKAEQVRIATEEEVQVAEENKNRQIIVAQKNKERTDAVETERVEKDRQLEATERERIVTLAEIDKEKAVEVERKNIQEVIRERVTVERSVVEEQEKIKDTEELALANRKKEVALTAAEELAQSELITKTKIAEASKQAAELKAEEDLVIEVKAAEASKKAAELHAEQIVIEAEAKQEAASKEATAKKELAEGITAEESASGLAEVQVKEAMANAIQKEGEAEANVMEGKFSAEAKGIEEKAAAMKLLDGVGKEHEEFKLNLNKEKEVELAQIQIQADIAAAQAGVLKEGLMNSNIEIIGGESMFFDRLMNSITTGKATDRMIHNSEVLTDVKETFFDGSGDFKTKIQAFVDQFGVSAEDLKNLSAAALLSNLASQASGDDKSFLEGMLGKVQSLGLADQKVSKLLGV